MLRAGDGSRYVTFIEERHGSRRWADHVELVGSDPASTILTELAGWAVSAPPEIEGELLDAGATVVRRAFEMTRNLVDSPPPAEWRSLEPAEGLRCVSCNRPPEDVFPAWREAFGEGHPDRGSDSAAEALRERLSPLLAEASAGPVASLSELMTNDSDAVVAGILMIERHGYPWVGELFRAPDHRNAGAGSLLLRRALAQSALAGYREIGLDE